jgi:hypothetical protein
VLQIQWLLLTLGLLLNVTDAGANCRRRGLLQMQAVIAGTWGYCRYRGLLQIQGVIVDSASYSWHRGLLLGHCWRCGLLTSRVVAGTARYCWDRALLLRYSWHCCLLLASWVIVDITRYAVIGGYC